MGAVVEMNTELFTQEDLGYPVGGIWLLRAEEGSETGLQTLGNRIGGDGASWGSQECPLKMGETHPSLLIG